MKIGWLHDFSLEEHNGGAQLTNEGMIAGAPEWADVVRCYPGEMQEADAYIINNVRLFNFQELLQATAKPYVMYEHDHWTNAPEWQVGRVKYICERAVGMVFLSPLHRRRFLEMWRVCPRRAECVPSAIDPALFYSNGADRNDTVWLGTFHNVKGIREAVAWAAQNGLVHFYGRGPHTPKGKNVWVYDWLPYDAVPGMLARYERLLFLPQGAEAFGRTVAEAYLSGCELVCNDHVGALSWGWQTRQEWADNLDSAPTTFWRLMENWLWV
jgi:hypothetical protein